MQTISNSIQIAHQLLLKVLSKKGVFLDGTMGNGYDTLFFVKNCVDKSKIYAIDIQSAAIENTRKLLLEEFDNNKDCEINLLCDDHANLGLYIKERLDGAIFNLGYLPKGKKTITTKVSSTMKALTWVLSTLNINGVLAVILYPGHAAGLEEYNTIETYVKTLPKKYFTVGWYKMANHKFEAPTLCWIEKVGNLNESN